MGYYSRIDLFDLEIQPEKAAEVVAAIASAQRDGDRPFGVSMLELDLNQLWRGEEHSPVQKWKLDDPLLDELAGWCSRGWVAFWSCEGDGGHWAYELDGKGGYHECSARRVSALRAAETRRFRSSEQKGDA